MFFSLSLKLSPMSLTVVRYSQVWTHVYQERALILELILYACKIKKNKNHCPSWKLVFFLLNYWIIFVIFDINLGKSQQQQISQQQQPYQGIQLGHQKLQQLIHRKLQLHNVSPQWLQRLISKQSSQQWLVYFISY